MTAIEVSRLTKRFGETLVVDDLSFRVSPGRIVGFLGSNGAGKTTTLRILLGLVDATAGTSARPSMSVSTCQSPKVHASPSNGATIGAARNAAAMPNAPIATVNVASPAGKRTSRYASPRQLAASVQ